MSLGHLPNTSLLVRSLAIKPADSCSERCARRYLVDYFPLMLCRLEIVVCADNQMLLRGVLLAVILR